MVRMAGKRVNTAIKIVTLLHLTGSGFHHLSTVDRHTQSIDARYMYVGTPRTSLSQCSIQPRRARRYTTPPIAQACDFVSTSTILPADTPSNLSKLGADDLWTAVS